MITYMYFCPSCGERATSDKATQIICKSCGAVYKVEFEGKVDFDTVGNPIFFKEMNESNPIEKEES